jgi:branched-chain amino acid transport system substrate-binding protein
MRNALELAINRFDSEIGGTEIETFVRDSATDPGTAVPAANELITEQNIDILIGGFSSAVILALQDIVKREELLYMANGGGAVSITGEECNKYTFAAHSGGHQFAGAPTAAYDEGMFNSIFVLAGDYAAGRETADAVELLIGEERDGEVSGPEFFPLGNDDFSSQISAARQSGADVCYVISAGFDIITFFNQAVSAGLDEEMDLFFVFTGIDFAKAVDAEERGGILGGSHYYWETEEGQEFGEEYRDEFDSVPDWFTAPAFDSCMEALSAIDREGTTVPDDLIPSLEGREFNWSRPCRWRACDHRAIQPFYLLEAKDTADVKGSSFYDVIGSLGGEEIMRACGETGCDL